MTNSSKTIDDTGFAAGSAAYLEDLYGQYHSKPESLSEEWRDTFEAFEQTSLKPSFTSATSYSDDFVSQDDIRRQAAVQRLLRRYQVYGHLNANLDPLGLSDDIFYRRSQS